MKKTKKEIRDENFIKENQGKYFCKCGCGQEIPIKSYHSWYGIPDYISGHNMVGNKWPRKTKQKIRMKTKEAMHRLEVRKKQLLNLRSPRSLRKMRGKISHRRGITFKQEYGEQRAKKINEKHSKTTIKTLSDIKIRKKMSAKGQGIDIKDWKEFTGNKPYTEEFNNKFKRAVRKRDNYVCMLCNIHQEKLYQPLSIHHIDYDKKLSIPQNCISLCHKCHPKTNLNRKHWTKFFQSLLSEKYGYKYSEDNKIILDVSLKESS